MERAAGLEHKLDTILLQLPPTLKADADLLRECLAQFPAGTRVAVEPRHESWWTDEIRALLERYGAALCWADRDEKPVAPLWRTADWGYLRFHHGVEGWAYRPETLQLWADRLAAAYGDEDVLVYFNNDPGCAAVADAVVFADAVRRAGGTPTRVPTAEQAAGLAWDAEPGRRRRARGRRRSSACRTPSCSAASPSSACTARVSASGMTALSVRPARRHSVTSISSCA